MTSQVIAYIIIIILLATIMFQQQLTVASPKDGKDNQTIKFQSVIPESPTNSDAAESSSIPTTISDEQLENDVVHFAALGCLDNTSKPHGPVIEEP